MDRFLKIVTFRKIRIFLKSNPSSKTWIEITAVSLSLRI